MKWFILSIVIMMTSAGIWALFLGAIGFYRTGVFLASADKKVPGKFLEYYSDVSLEPSYLDSRRSTNPPVSYYPIFEYRSSEGYTQKVKSDQRHLSHFYNSGEKIKVWESKEQHIKSRIAGFYSLFLLDSLTTLFGLLFIIVPISLYSSFSPAITSLDHEIHGIQSEPVIVDRLGSSNYNEREAFERYGKDREKSNPQNLTRVIAQILHDTGALKYINFLIWFMAIIFFISIISNIPYFWKHFIFEFTPPGQFLRSIQTNEKVYINKYLEHGWGINWKDKFEQNALLVALDEKNYFLVKKLVEMGANVNVTSKLNYTPLDYAIKNNETDIVKLLLEKGAEINSCKQQPLLHVVKNKNIKMLHMMIRGGADVRREYDNGHGQKISILQFATINNWKEGADTIEATQTGFYHELPK